MLAEETAYTKAMGTSVSGRSSQCCWSLGEKESGEASGKKKGGKATQGLIRH